MHETLERAGPGSSDPSLCMQVVDLPTQDDELLPEEGVFCHELGLASGEVSHGSHYERGVGWVGQVDEAAVERLKAHTCQARDEDENPLHSVCSPFVKMSR